MVVSSNPQRSTICDWSSDLLVPPVIKGNLKTCLIGIQTAPSSHLNCLNAISFLHRPNRWGTNGLVGAQQVRNSALRQTFYYSTILISISSYASFTPSKKRSSSYIKSQSFIPTTGSFRTKTFSVSLIVVVIYANRGRLPFRLNSVSCNSML